MRPSTRSPKNSSRSFDTAPMLAWESASFSSDGSEKVWPSWASSVVKVSIDELADPAVPDGRRPFPEFPEVRAAIGGEEDDFRFADEILERNITHTGAAVRRIVPVVAHHEVVPFGNDEHLRVVQIALRIAVKHVVRDAIGQGLAILRHVMRLAAEILNVILNLHLRHGLIVDIENAVLHLHPVARQTDQTLDVIGRVVARELEHHYVATLGRRSKEAARERDRAEGERIAAVAVCGFRNEKIVADQQRVFHGTGRDVERLENEGTDHACDQQRVKDGLDDLEPRFLFLRTLGTGTGGGKSRRRLLPVFIRHLKPAFSCFFPGLPGNPGKKRKQM